MSLQGKSVLVIGRSSGIARAIVDAALAEGARVTVAGRDAEKLRQGYGDTATAETVDVTDDASIQALAERVGSLDHLVTTASARARGLLKDLDRDSLLKSFDTKVIGPAMLANRIGDVDDIAQAAIFAMTNRFLTGVTLRIDGGEPLT